MHPDCRGGVKGTFDSGAQPGLADVALLRRLGGRFARSLSERAGGGRETQTRTGAMAEPALHARAGRGWVCRVCQRLGIGCILVWLVVHARRGAGRRGECYFLLFFVSMGWVFFVVAER